jgi:hypothetical protein
MLPQGTKISTPMFIITRETPPKPMESIKLTFPDGERVVLQASLVQAYSAPDAVAFMRKKEFWKITAATRPSGIMLASLGLG